MGPAWTALPSSDTVLEERAVSRWVTKSIASCLLLIQHLLLLETECSKFLLELMRFDWFCSFEWLIVDGSRECSSYDSCEFRLCFIKLCFGAGEDEGVELCPRELKLVGTVCRAVPLDELWSSHLIVLTLSLKASIQSSRCASLIPFQSRLSQADFN